MSLTRSVDVLVIGAGPSGLAAATALRNSGVEMVEVVDRELIAGGIPRHCLHTGFGVRDQHRVLSGPRYAQRLSELAARSGAVIRTGVMVTGWDPLAGLAGLAPGRAHGLGVFTTSPAGCERILAGAVVLATGARERPRNARLVPGDRPAGIWTTGQLQQSVHLRHAPIGTVAVVVGAELVSHSAVVTLAHAGVRVAAMLTDQPRSQISKELSRLATARYRYRLLTGARLARIIGRSTVTAVEVIDSLGVRQIISCDTVVFTGDWVPDHELARAAGLEMDPRSRGPLVDTGFRTTAAGVFAVGNLVHPVEAADVCALDGPAVVPGVLAHLAGELPGRRLALLPRGALAWVAPGALDPRAAPPRHKFVLWAAHVVERPVVRVLQGERQLHRARLLSALVPGRPAHLSSSWAKLVDPFGGPITITTD